MKRLFGSSCVGLLVILTIGSVTALFVFSIVFNQSQALTTSATATVVAHASATRYPADTPRPPIATVAVQIDDVIVQIDTDATPTVPASVENSAATNMALTPNNISTLTPSPAPDETETYVPRHSGTSSYPLTVTAEVMLAQTNVARYQADIGATYTAVAIESENIFGTLTAQAPVTLTAQAVTP